MSPIFNGKSLVVPPGALVLVTDCNGFIGKSTLKSCIGLNHGPGPSTIMLTFYTLKVVMSPTSFYKLAIEFVVHHEVLQRQHGPKNT